MMPKTNRLVALTVPLVMGIVFALVAAAPVRAAAEEREDGEEIEPEETIRRIEVKRYTELDPRTVWRVIDNDQVIDVRFSDVISARRRPGRGLSAIRVDRQTYRIAAVFQTEGDITCLVPADQRDTITKIFNLREGQKITVEGRTIGTRGTLRLVLVDRVLTGGDEQSEIEHQLIFSWPGTRQVRPKLVVKPGDYTMQFPCRYKRDQKEDVVVIVNQMSRKRFEAQLAKLQEKEEEENEEEGNGRKPPEKRYLKFNPDKVYEHILQGNYVNVQFKDRVKQLPRRIPRAVRDQQGRSVRVGGGLETYIGVICLLRAQDTELIEQARNAVEGMDVTVKGTTLPAQGIHKPVLVDELELPISKIETPDVWLVQVFWGDDKPRLLYKVGTYNLNFPCRYVEGRTERVRVELREVRVIKGKVEGVQAQGEEMQPREEE